jgi:xylulokinase
MFLGLDLGTSSVKALLVDDAQAEVGAATAPLTVSRPRPGWSEQDPADWIAAAGAALDALAAAHPAAMAAVEGVGLSGQMHGAVLLDAADAPLRPAILWNDGRCGAECAALDARADYRGIGGNLVMAGFTAPKLEWVRVHEPALFERTARVLLPKDWLRLWLTGEAATDPSDASGTLWLDVGRRDWSPALLAASHLSPGRMPRLVEGSAASGRLRPALAARWGMASAPVVAGGAGDNAAAACGVGAVAPGGAFVTIGTSGVLFAATDRFAPNTAGAVHAMCHALPGVWHQMGVVLAAADALAWLGEVTGADPAALASEAGAARPCEAFFLPYLSGERTPHADPGARGAFVGLSRGADRATLARAVLEGVAFALADCRDALEAAGTAVGPLWAVGGGARSAVWTGILAAALDRPLTLTDGADRGAAFGAARLGMLAATGADPASVCRAPALSAQVDPDPALVARYADARARWRALYPALRALGPQEAP